MDKYIYIYYIYVYVHMYVTRYAYIIPYNSIRINVYLYIYRGSMLLPTLLPSAKNHQKVALVVFFSPLLVQCLVEPVQYPSGPANAWLSSMWLCHVDLGFSCHDSIEVQGVIHPMLLVG